MVRGQGGFRPTALRAALWLLLGGWLGAWVLFAFGVAPTAFGSLPPEAAGAVVGPVLAGLHLYGGLAGLGLALLARALGRGAWMVALPVLAGALCLISHFGVTAGISGLRGLAFGPQGSTEAAERFWWLHGISMTLYTAVGILVILLVWLHARADTGAAASVETPGAATARR
jgi:hypothetical protein